VRIKLPDGSLKEMEEGATALDLAASISKGLARASMAARINGKVRDLLAPLSSGDAVELLKFDAREGREVFWHTSAHVMAQAVKALFPDVKVAIGPAIETGFYYDFDTPHRFTPEDFEKIEAKMREIVSQSLPLIRRELPRDEAVRLFEDLKEPYKTELVRELPEGEAISVYTEGDFTDLCRGPHLPHTGMVKAFKLLSVAGAYWRGSEKNPMLQCTCSRRPKSATMSSWARNSTCSLSAIWLARDCPYSRQRGRPSSACCVSLSKKRR
jgi:threonyl-tRNA synthetase